MDQKSKHSTIILFLSRIFKFYFRFELIQLTSQSFYYFFSLAYAKEGWQRENYFWSILNQAILQLIDVRVMTGISLSALEILNYASTLFVNRHKH